MLPEAAMTSAGMSLAGAIHFGAALGLQWLTLIIIFTIRCLNH